MKKLYSKFIAMAICLVFIFGCGDKSPSIIEEPVVEPEPSPNPVAPTSPEAHKEALQVNGIAFVNQLTLLKNTDGFKASSAFMEILSASDVPNLPNGRAGEIAPIQFLAALSAFGQRSNSAEEMFVSLAPGSENFSSITHLYNDLKGVYTYYKGSNSWTFSPGGSSIMFKFPSTPNGWINNAQFVIHGLTTKYIANGIAGPDYEGDYPTKLNAYLSVEGVSVLDYVFTADYLTNGLPSTANIAINLSSFKIVLDAKNQTTEAGVGMTLSNGDLQILSFGVNATGNFSRTNVDNASSIDQVVTKAFPYLTVMNIKIAGDVNPGQLQRDIDNASSLSAMARAWNTNSKLTVSYVDSEKTLANTELYATSREECYTYCFSWDNFGNCIATSKNCYISEQMNFRLIFEDGSKADLDTFVAVGFAGLEQAWTNFISSF